MAKDTTTVVRKDGNRVSSPKEESRGCYAVVNGVVVWVSELAKANQAKRA